MKLSSFLLILFVAFLWFGQSPATGHGKSPRDLAMHSLAKHMKVISQSLKGEAAASEVGYKKSVEIMKISKRMKDLFAMNDSSRPNSRASSKIWTENEAFQETISLFSQAAFALSEAFKDGNQKDIENAFRKTGAQCGYCHKRYRLPKK